MAQQTAMQKLLTNLESIGITIPLGVKMVYLRIEKEQMINAYNQDLYGGLSGDKKFDDGEQYYNETYGSQGSPDTATSPNTQNK